MSRATTRRHAPLHHHHPLTATATATLDTTISSPPSSSQPPSPSSRPRITTTARTTMMVFVLCGEPPAVGVFVSVAKPQARGAFGFRCGTIWGAFGLDITRRVRLAVQNQLRVRLVGIEY
ncbi:hypothetical protein Tco_1494375 [Tanacetum coccineum]